MPLGGTDQPRDLMARDHCRVPGPFSLRASDWLMRVMWQPGSPCQVATAEFQAPSPYEHPTGSRRPVIGWAQVSCLRVAGDTEGGLAAASL